MDVNLTARHHQRLLHVQIAPQHVILQLLDGQRHVPVVIHNACHHADYRVVPVVADLVQTHHPEQVLTHHVNMLVVANVH